MPETKPTISEVIARILPVPRSFAELEIAEIEAFLKAETAKNPLYPTGLDAVLLHNLVALARDANRRNLETVKAYRLAVHDWAENRTHNPEKYTLAIRPTPARKLLVSRGKVEGSPYEWPLWVVSEELVCEPVPLPTPDDPSKKPLTISIGPENPRTPGEYQALPDDNAPDGYSFPASQDGTTVIWTKRIFATPFGSVGIWRCEAAS